MHTSIHRQSDTQKRSSHMDDQITADVDPNMRDLIAVEIQCMHTHVHEYMYTCRVIHMWSYMVVPISSICCKGQAQDDGSDCPEQSMFTYTHTHTGRHSRVFSRIARILSLCCKHPNKGEVSQCHRHAILIQFTQVSKFL